MFVRSADRRASIWMEDYVKAADDTSALCRHKLNHAALNRTELRQSMGKKRGGTGEEILESRYLWGLGPWTGNEGTQ